MTTEFASMPEMDEETTDLWDAGIQEWMKKGGFAELLKNIPTRSPTLDLNTYLPTLTEIGKLDRKVGWVLQGIIVKQGINTLTAPGGLLKTTVCTQIGTCVTEGKPFAGLPTDQMPVWYIDFENPLSSVCDKARIYGPSEMRVWHLSNSFPPPRLDSKEDWKLYKSLIPGLLIIDTLRSAQELDENSSKDMATVMNRLKDLREYGHTILLIHHAPKANDRTYKGSTAISDLSDHCLVLERVRAIGSDEAVYDEDDSDLPLRLGVRGKTRFEASAVFLKFDPSIGFTLAENPDLNTLDQLRQILSDSNGEGLNQTQFFKAAKELNIRRSKFQRLLKKGQGEYWEKLPGLYRNSVAYRVIYPVTQSVAHGTPYNCQNRIAKVPENIELPSCPRDEKTNEAIAVNVSCPVAPHFISGANGQLNRQQEEETTDLVEENDEGE